MKTVGELKRALRDLPDDTWVVIKGDGPLTETWTELGAAEPFVVLGANTARLAGQSKVQRFAEKSAMSCEHANEMPAKCPCKPDCYCKRPGGPHEAVEMRTEHFPPRVGDKVTRRLIIDETILKFADADDVLEKCIKEFEAAHPYLKFLAVEATSAANPGFLSLRCRFEVVKPATFGLCSCEKCKRNTP